MVLVDMTMLTSAFRSHTETRFITSPEGYFVSWTELLNHLQITFWKTSASRIKSIPGLKLILGSARCPFQSVYDRPFIREWNRPKGDILIVMGDLNAKVCFEKSLAYGWMCDRETRSWRRFVIGCTLFEHKACHQHWLQPRKRSPSDVR